MSTITSTPAAARIAQIRSAMGHSTNTTKVPFQLDDVLGTSSSGPSVFTVGQSSLDTLTTFFDGQGTTASPTQSVGLSPDAVAVSSGVSDTVPYASEFNNAGQLHGIAPALLAAVAEIESAFDPVAISSAGAQGLMQFMPATAGEMGVDPFDPASAVDGAARYLRRELDRFGSVELALAAYNAGAGAVRRHGGVPPFAETQRYVDKVLNALESHR